MSNHDNRTLGCSRKQFGAGILSVVLCMVLALPYTASHCLGSEQPKPKRAPSGTHGTSSVGEFVEAVWHIFSSGGELRVEIGEYLKELECWFDLVFAMQLEFAAHWSRESAEALLQTLAKNPNAESFLGTFETWRAIVERDKESLRGRWGEGVDVDIRMIRAKLTLPIADNDSEVLVIDAGEAISISDAEGIVVEIANYYLSRHDQLPEPNEKGFTEKDTPITFLCLQLHFARKVRAGTSVVEKTAEKGVPTAQIWIVYDVVKKPESGGSGQHGLVQHVDIRRCELAYESGAWRTVK